MTPAKSKNFIKFLILQISILSYITHVEGQAETIWDIVHWEPVTRGGYAVMKRPDPAGTENGFVMYLCRATMANGNRRIGSLWVYSRRLYCRVSSDGQQFDFNHYDMLDEPPGATSWIPLGSELPKYIIGDAETPDGNPGYVCRGIYEDDLIVGTLDPRDMTCYAARSDVEHTITDGIEVLVLNFLGLYS